MNRSSPLLPLLLLLTSAASAAAAAEQLHPAPAVRTFHETAFSPDGKYLAYTESVPSPENEHVTLPALFLLDMDRKSAKPRRLMQPSGEHSCRESGLTWTGDSRHLAFVSDCLTPGQSQLFVASADSFKPKQLTHLTGALANPRWSPDGQTIALLWIENAPRAAGPLEPAVVQTGVIEEAIFEQRLALVDVANGAARPISPADTYVYEFDWSPDSTQLVYTAAKGSGDDNWYIAQLWRVDVRTAESHLVLKPSGQIAVPRWSPDGSTIAFIQGLMSDEGSTGGDVYLVGSTGGEPRNLTPHRGSSPAFLAWTSPHSLIITERVDGGAAIASLSTTSGTAERLWQVDESFRAGAEDLSISLTSTGAVAALIRSSWLKPPEVWAGRIGDFEPVTEENKDVPSACGEVRKLHWSVGPQTVQGWLLLPKSYDPSKRYPLVVAVHGGPAAQLTPSWPYPGFNLSALSAEGYFVLFPNPRGSYGAGEDFTRGNVRDFGYGDFRDIMAGVDEALRSFPIDPARLGIAGWSYGGYMTMWAVTQTNRFHAAVAGAGIANLQSYYGENLIDQWMIPYFGASVYDEPQRYARSSPITFIKNVHTPTLILVGDRDAECPAPQSYEFWHALKTLGVKTQLVVYPNEGHSFHDHRHREDVEKRTIDWLNENLR